jgi:two-component system, chemotaxis family, sensor kinase Cph1
MDATPAFGQADLTNCERELIHLAGSIQPHGALIVLRAGDLVVVQASANAAEVLGWEAGALLGRASTILGGDLSERIAFLQRTATLDEPVHFQCLVETRGARRALEGALHRHPAGGELIVELEPCDGPTRGTPPPSGLVAESLHPALAAAVQRFAAAPTVSLLADAVVQAFRELTGYDRVMVYKFDPDGHGKVIAEARHPRLDSLLGHHYPATDIPQRARSLYLRNRVRMLVDVDYAPAALVPEGPTSGGDPLDMSLCALRSMSPIHLQYLRNMGVTATLTASLVREGKLWGLVAAHHYEPRYLRLSMRAAADLLAEVASSRITAIESYAHAQVALMVRRLEQRLIEATSTEGDWRYALLRNPRTLLQPLEATGAALYHDGEVLTCGEVPSTPELRALLDWVRQHTDETPFASDCIGKENPTLASLTPVASGVLAVRLSTSKPEYLMWFRKEQLQTVTWAGDPNKPMVDNDPLELSPRRSFAAWSEIVRGTALPWSSSELTLARAIGVALADIILQVQAVRLLIAEHALAQTRDMVASAGEPVLVTDAQGRLLFANDASMSLAGRTLQRGEAASNLFRPAAALAQALAEQRRSPQTWRRELDLVRGEGTLPVSVRAEVVNGRDGAALGHIVTIDDLRERRRTAAARLHLEASLREASFGIEREADEVVSAIAANASLAAMDIADARGGPPVAPMLQELEASARRAASLYGQIRRFNA